MRTGKKNLIFFLLI